MSSPVSSRAPLPGSWSHLANFAVLGVLWLGSAVVYDGLPERIPMHFGLDGTADRWVERSWPAWMALPMIALAVAGVTYLAAWLVALKPDLVNMPDKKRYAALPVDSKILVLHVVQRFVFWLTTVISLVMMSTQVGSWLVATGRSESLPWWSLASVLALLVATPFTTVLVVLRTNSLINRLSAPHR